MGYTTRMRRSRAAQHEAQRQVTISPPAKKLMEQHQLALDDVRPNAKGRITVKEVKAAIALIQPPYQDQEEE